MAVIQGKGYFIWRAERVLGRAGLNAAEAAKAARAAGIEHVVVKIADGTKPFPLPDRDDHAGREQATRDLIKALQQEGIAVFGFSFVYGQRQAPEAQAQVFADRARLFNVKGLVINAEDIGTNRWSSSGGAERAGKLARALRAAAGADAVLALSSYRFPRYQPHFPFDAFMAECDIAMPQIYWVTLGGAEGDAVQALIQSVEAYRERYPDRLIVPTGAAYGERQSDGTFWSATPRQIKRFLKQARSMGLPAVNFWSWEHAVNDPENERTTGAELWEAVAAVAYRPGQEGAGGPDDPGDGAELEIRAGAPGYFDGVYAQFPKARFEPFERGGQAMKYAETVGATPSSVWVVWRPDIAVSGRYEVSVWVPGTNATTRRARYHVHGVVGKPEPVSVEIDQYRHSDTWVSLGAFELNADDPASGQVNLTNFTGEDDRRVGIAAVRWRKVRPPDPSSVPLADGFDPPVGTEAERRGAVWPGQWVDVNPYGRLYTLRGKKVFHTGADLNLNKPTFDLDALAPVYAIGSGEVTYAGFRDKWGNIVIIRHDPLEPNGPRVYSRYAHLENMDVKAGDRVGRGQRIGRVGRGDPKSPVPFHLHFDISPTEALADNPGDWPGLDNNRIRRDYVDPRAYIRDHRPR